MNVFIIWTVEAYKLMDKAVLVTTLINSFLAIYLQVRRILNWR